MKAVSDRPASFNSRDLEGSTEASTGKRAAGDDGAAEVHAFEHLQIEIGKNGVCYLARLAVQIQVVP